MKKLSLLFLVLSFNICLFQSCKGSSDKENGNSISNEKKDDDDDDDFDPSKVFVGSVDMKISTNNASDNHEMPTMTYYSNGEKLAIKMNIDQGKGMQKEMRMIFDPKEKTMTTLEATSKMAMVMKIPDLTGHIDEDSLKMKNVKVEKTNETKDIEGFKCRKIILTSDDGVYEFWITKEIKGTLAGLMGQMGGNNKNPFGDSMKSMKGFVLEAKLQNTDSNDIVTMNFTNIKLGQPDAALFSTDGYKVQDMSSLMKGMGK